jgi:hypothetical protein
LEVRKILKQKPNSQAKSFLIYISNISFLIRPELPERCIQEKLKNEF